MWYVRIRRKHGSGYYQKSLKTTSEGVAVEAATKIYMDMWTTETKGLKYVDARFNELFMDFLENSQLHKHRYTRAKRCVQALL